MLVKNSGMGAPMAYEPTKVKKVPDFKRSAKNEARKLNDFTLIGIVVYRRRVGLLATTAVTLFVVNYLPWIPQIAISGLRSIFGVY